jgi:hypothetical protein
MKPGQKFGNLTILKIVGNKAECSCTCGSITQVYLSEIEGKTNCGQCYIRKRGRIKRPSRRPEMNTPEYKKWRTAVYRRDKYKCRCCDSGFRINAHHLNGWSWAVNQRYEVNNGVTLCYSCHDSFHFFFGRGQNTRDQFVFFLYTYYGRHL